MTLSEQTRTNYSSGLYIIYYIEGGQIYKILLTAIKLFSPKPIYT